MKIHPHLVRAVVASLHEIFSTHKYADKVIEHALKAHPKWGSRDRKFFAESVYHCVRHRRLLSYALTADESEGALRHSSDTELFKLWYLGFYHLSGEFPKVPEELSFKVDESVLARLKATPDVRIAESFSDEFADYALKTFGSEWPALAEALNQTADVYIRVNRLKIQIDELIAVLAEEDCLVDPVPGVPEALRLRVRKNVFSLSSFKKGFFEVQDAGSQMIAPLLGAQPGERVCDACAGGGGKTLHLASMMKNKGRIISMDVHEWKLEELKRRARRNGVDIVETRLIEGSKTIKRLDQSFDRVLLDAPCSGSGVIRRNPDAKWKFKTSDLDRLLTLQKEILFSYSMMAKPGGVVVYATCSLFPDENEKQVQYFLEAHPQWTLEKEIHLMPHREGFDGFYAALLRRPLAAPVR